MYLVLKYTFIKKNERDSCYDEKLQTIWHVS